MACAGHAQQLQGAVRVIEAAGPLAWWRVPLVVAGFAALVMAAAFLTHVEKRHPLAHFKSRRFQARCAGGRKPFRSSVTSHALCRHRELRRGT